MPLGRAVIPLVGLAAVGAACTPTHYAGASEEQRAVLEARAQARCPARPPHPFTSAAARKSADEGLHACVSQHGHPGIGNLMYYGVRIGGHPLLPFPWRWGYGWDRPYRYP